MPEIYNKFFYIWFIYRIYVKRLRRVCTKYLNFLKYVENTILDQVKDKIVYALTHKVRHFKNTTPNIFEYVHGTLTNWLVNNV